MDKISFFILNIVLNSFLAFLTTTLLVEFLIAIFRIKQSRLASYLRMIPLFKLILDPFLYDYSRWAYGHAVNPLNCLEGTRTLSLMFGTLNPISEGLSLPFLSGIQMTVYDNLTFTVADIIGYLLTPTYLKTFTIIFGFTSAVIVLNHFKYYLSCIREIKHVKELRGEIRKKIRNAKLKSCVKKYSLNVVITPRFHGSPFVIGLISPTIFIPKTLLSTLSQKEYEAVLAHEIEHVCYKDSLIRLILGLICSIFWWVPTKWLRNRIEEGQERGCDSACKKYDIYPLDLASAICKSAKVISLEKPFLAYHLAKNHTVYRRINALLTPKPLSFKKTRFVLAGFAVSVAFFGILFGRYWMF